MQTEITRDQNFKGMKILLAEDSEEIRLLLDLQLRRHGIVLEFAVDGDDALQKATGKLFDLIIMDIQMPKRNGHEVTRALRQEGLRTPIIALSGHAFEEERRQSKDAGCDKHLVKPCSEESLLAAIREVLA